MKTSRTNLPCNTQSYRQSISFFLIIISLLAVSEAYPGNETDRMALLAIKSQLVEHPDGVLRSWNSSLPHCYWEGVICGRKHNRVTMLDLNSRGLSGTISPSIGNLSFLQSIMLHNNSLHGKIPPEVGHLFRLQEIVLNNNTLGGEIPANLSGCINLRLLSIGFNMVEGKLPPELGKLSKLEALEVHFNNLTGPLFEVIQNITSLYIISTTRNSFTGTIPSTFGRMQIKWFEVDANELSGTVPSSIFNISSLRVLDLSMNQLQGNIPPDTGYAKPYLTRFSLGFNQFSGSIPSSMLNLTHLRYLDLEANRFTGKVPYGFGQFPNLTFLALADNYLTGDINFINTLLNCTLLRILDLRLNGFSGNLPESIANLSTTLTRLELGPSPISGSFPAGITNLINLISIQISCSELTGSLPADLWKLHKLQVIDFSSSRLIGRIPDSLGNLSHLSELHLEDNHLGGSIPPSLANCQYLLYLNLSHNNLSGTLPSELFKGSAKFVKFDVSQNDLQGSLPLEINRQINLGWFGVSDNNFSGEIPDTLADWPALEYLYMGGNSFHGQIPPSLKSLASLQEADFSCNNLSGRIPVYFTKFPLIYLNVSYNNLEGEVPTDGVFANASAVFVVGNSKLCGGIPALHLHKCIDHKRMSLVLKLVVSIISALVGALAVAAGFYLACIRKKNKHVSSSPSAMEGAFLKLSYDMLLKATNGFSSENLLGAGTFGTVFKGIIDEGTVAVKVIDLQHHGASKSFMAECKALRNIRHRNLLKIITACSSMDFQGNDFKALVYEFMPNGSLHKWVHEAGNLSLLQRVNIAIDVAHALNYLHHECDTPIVHCDLKPSNVLLDKDMVAHVGDFGLAKFLAQPQHQDQSSTVGIRGTIGYAAPEYGLGSEVSTDGDLYSYGILLLELMTGKRPTDIMFKEDFNFHMYAEAAIPDQVEQIVDLTLGDDGFVEDADDMKREHQATAEQRIECMISIVQVGVACSNHLPQDRMRIADVISKLTVGRDKLLDSRNKRKATW